MQEENGDKSATSPHQSRLGQRYTVQEAAEILGTTVDGVRSRIRRGSLDSMKVSGQVFVLLDPDQSRPGSDESQLGETSPDQSDAQDDSGLLEAKEETISELKDQVEFLRRELERKDTLLMTLMQRVPELEAAPEPSDSPRGAAGGPGGSSSGPQDQERASWWRRIFGS